MSRADILFLVWLVALGILFYVYYGYLLVLRLLAWATTKVRAAPPESPLPTVTVLLTVHNEEDRIGAKLDNLLALDYDRDCMEIVVASDGSTDRTADIVLQYTPRTPLRLLSFERLGKSEAQNRAISESHGEIIAFTDADSILASDYMRELVRHFADKRVGCVTANLRRPSGGSGLAHGQSYYWNYEIKLRELESKLGILAVASGTAMAVRRSAFVPLPPDVGEDCIVPLDVALQELKVIHATTAHAVDRMESEPLEEFRARVRMTLRNWIGTWRRPSLLNPISHPGYAFALWSHKLLRWLSPVLILIVSITSFGFIGHPILWPLSLLTVIFFALAGLGWLAQIIGVGLPVIGAVYGFCLANLGFLIGVARALAGRSVVSYTKINKSADN
jgi:cellulose synthase/poly-beta-1,6-N-acetylglucosamine synthase-like glycosyltransferase